jgi:hypothetical protein
MMDTMGLDVKDLARDTVDAVLMEGQRLSPEAPDGMDARAAESVGRVLVRRRRMNC